MLGLEDEVGIELGRVEGISVGNMLLEGSIEGNRLGSVEVVGSFVGRKDGKRLGVFVGPSIINCCKQGRSVKVSLFGTGLLGHSGLILIV